MTNLKIGLIADVHYADSEPRIGRHYRESLGKMREAVARFADATVDAVVVLGDVIDTPQPPDPAKEAVFLRRMAETLAQAGAPVHFVLGNHCVAALTKAEFLQTVGQADSRFSFDRNGVHGVLLDACFRADETAYTPGNFVWTDSEIPREERDWLKADLAATTFPTLVFVHQRLDEAPDADYRIGSRRDVRRILRESGNVRAVFQGHSHKNELQTIEGIPYITLHAMGEGSGPENSGYSILTVEADGTLRLDGFRHHADHPFAIRKN